MHGHFQPFLLDRAIGPGELHPIRHLSLPVRTEIVEGAGAVAHELGELFMPTRNVKSLALRLPCSPPVARSTMMPLMPSV